VAEGREKAVAPAVADVHPQLNEWVALLYFESQKAMQSRSKERAWERFDLSGVAAIAIHITVRKAL
jgi:hypothetical protein